MTTVADQLRDRYAHLGALRQAGVRIRMDDWIRRQDRSRDKEAVRAAFVRALDAEERGEALP